MKCHEVTRNLVTSNTFLNWSCTPENLISILHSIFGTWLNSFKHKGRMVWSLSFTIKGKPPFLQVPSIILHFFYNWVCYPNIWLCKIDQSSNLKVFNMFMPLVLVNCRFFMGETLFIFCMLFSHKPIFIAKQIYFKILPRKMHIFTPFPGPPKQFCYQISAHIFTFIAMALCPCYFRSNFHTQGRV